MDKCIKTPSVSTAMAMKELNCIIQLWRTQRKILNDDLEDNLCAGLLGDSTDQHIEPLCERLMDYVSVGHFNVYEKLLRQNQMLENEHHEMLRAIYHNIESSTDQALNFNDKYVGASTEYCEGLNNDLQKLNKSLAVRFVLEEQMVEILQE